MRRYSARLLGQSCFGRRVKQLRLQPQRAPTLYDKQLLVVKIGYDDLWFGHDEISREQKQKQIMNLVGREAAESRNFAASVAIFFLRSRSASESVFAGILDR